MNMAQYSSGVGPPIPPTQSINENAQLVNNSADWNGGPLASPYPTAQHINNLTDSNAAPQAVLCQTADGVTGYVIWHGVPEAFPHLFIQHLILHQAWLSRRCKHRRLIAEVCRLNIFRASLRNSILGSFRRNILQDLEPMMAVSRLLGKRCRASCLCRAQRNFVR